MKQKLGDAFKSFSLEIPLYAVLVLLYAWLVLRFLGGWLFQLFNNERKLYAAAALGLIIGQGFVLEALVRGLLWLVNRKRGK